MKPVKPILSKAGDIWICGNCRKVYVGYWDWEEGKIEFDDFCSRCGAPVLEKAEYNEEMEDDGHEEK